MVGQCFFYATPPHGEHLFVVLAPSLERAGWFICANISTLRPGSDTTCKLLASEHERLTNPVSVVIYAEARELPAALIQRCCQQQSLESFAPALLTRIHSGALSGGSRMKKGFQKAVRAHLGT